VNIIGYAENDLGTYDNVEIELKSGATYRMKPTEYKTPKAKVSGYTNEPQPKKEIFLKPEEIIVFFNNSSKTPNLEEAETIYLNDL
jgi:hypothetical protein